MGPGPMMKPTCLEYPCRVTLDLVEHEGWRGIQPLLSEPIRTTFCIFVAIGNNFFLFWSKSR